MSEFATVMDELGPDDAARSARATIDTALEQFSPVQREQFWNAIGLYYSTRRHPGAGDAPVQGEVPAV